MSWIELLYERVREHYSSGPIKINDIIYEFKKKYDYSSSQIYKGFDLLVKEKKLFRIYHGVYDYKERKKVTDISIKKTNFIQKIEPILDSKGIEYMLTGPSLLVKYFHHLPRNNIHLIYLLKGSGEYAVSSLTDYSFDVLLNPRKNDVRNYYTHRNFNDLIILREYSTLDGNKNGTAELERIMVDTYFESTRGRIPLTPRETGRIFMNIFRTNVVQINKLLKYSWRRGINEEINVIIEEYYNKKPENDNRYCNEYLSEVLLGMRE